ncbi:KTSC domain-containing protein [Cypionkella sp.]|uniref:KTSC domain-containing protein n=1 Tax=Cypionkella sp. TaxID=2811411 RepID=UPI00271D9568|nr:KTSC domain-containing protein [Cypionkella sp.]MDO8986088.1 KTSC domain-containing protein [Cypionkella sp.]
MPEVKSKMFSHVDYENGTLKVTMHGGKVYHHDGVPEATYQGMLASPSAGQFYNGQIKKAHPHRKTPT